MILRRLFWILVILGAAYYLYYHSQPHPTPLVHQKHEDSVDPREPAPYHRDGGFGTIDGAKDVRDEANREAARPQKAQDAIDKQ